MIKTDARERARELRRQCVRRLTDINVPKDYDLAGICDLVGQRRGRPIHRIPLVMRAAEPCGYWIATEAADFIIYEANTSKTHQEHIIAHELAHIICCHRGAATLDDETARILFPGLDPALVRDMLRRSAYSDFQEHEAEVMATVILQQVNQNLRRSGHATGAPRDVPARIEQSLTYRLS